MNKLGSSDGGMLLNENELKIIDQGISRIEEISKFARDNVWFEFTNILRKIKKFYQNERNTTGF